MINGVKSGVGYLNLLKKDEQKEVNRQQETESRGLSKVDEIKKAIQDGTYKIDIPLLAKKMADEINLERG